MTKEKIVISVISISLFALSYAAHSQEALYTDDKATVQNTETMTDERKLNISGLIRNDAYMQERDEEFKFQDILEARLIFERKTEDWNFYADGRVFLNYGELVKTESETDAKIMRAFARYFSPIGDFTLGKTYISLGNYGLFNPFDTDRSVNLTDPDYDKEGLLALEYVIPIGDVSGVKLYGGSANTEESSGDYNPRYLSGLSLYSNTFGFDFGVISMRNDLNKNLSGGYFKGDLVMGIQGAWATHFNDRGKYTNNEASLGVDYSFLRGKIIVTLLFYFNRESKTESSLHQNSTRTGFSSEYYLYGDIVYIHDEFLNTDISSFTSATDGSSIITPRVNITIANGLTMTLLVTFTTGKGDNNFSRKQYGTVSSMIRVEGKF